MVCDSLSMISCRSRNHSAGAFFGIQREQLIERATFLESARPLQVVELQVNLVPGRLGKSFRASARREVNRLANPAQGRMNVIQCDHCWSLMVANKPKNHN